VKVELYGSLRRGLYPNQLEIRIEGRVSLKDALRSLPEGLREQVIDENGSVRSGILILVNDVDARTVYGFNVTVSDSDRLAIIPMIHGGSPS